MEAVDSPAVEASVEAVVSEAAEREEVGNMQPKVFINNLQEETIVNAIAAAEKKTSGEIRVYISNKKRTDPVAAARTRFEKLGMTKTRLRNGVLIFIAPISQKFAVIGDAGIHEKCGDEFWQAISAGMGELFKQGLFTEAIAKAVREVGDALGRHFPIDPDDKNELPNEILRD